jgi:hypothetical protein
VDFIYSLGGRPFKRDNGHLWDRAGRYVGRFSDDMVFSANGSYLGELRRDRLGYRLSHAGRRRGSNMTRMNRMSTARGDRSARTIPSGWEDFQG